MNLPGQKDSKEKEFFFSSVLHSFPGLGLLDFTDLQFGLGSDKMDGVGGLMKRFIFIITLFLFFTGQSLFAGYIYGTVTHTDGSKSNGSSRVSTSWNGKNAYPSNGNYRLDLGSSAEGTVVTVYINGYCWGSVKVESGGTRVDITLKGSSGYPVGYPRSCNNRVD